MSHSNIYNPKTKLIIDYYSVLNSAHSRSKFLFTLSRFKLICRPILDNLRPFRQMLNSHKSFHHFVRFLWARLIWTEPFHTARVSVKRLHPARRMFTANNRRDEWDDPWEWRELNPLCPFVYRWAWIANWYPDRSLIARICWKINLRAAVYLLFPENSWLHRPIPVFRSVNLLTWRSFQFSFSRLLFPCRSPAPRLQRPLNRHAKRETSRSWWKH